MKFKNSLITLICFGTFLVLPILLGNNSNLISVNDRDNELESLNPKSSWYNNSENPIYIDASATGVGAHNWTWARIQSWCQKGDGSWGNPYIIENVSIDATTDSGIHIHNSKNEYFRIQNCTIYDAHSTSGYAGIKLENSNNGTIFNNTCSDNDYSGILLTASSINNTILNNTANDNRYNGIWVQASCTNNYLINNTAEETAAGQSQDYGIRLLTASNNTISGNYLKGNTQYGIYLTTSDGCNITQNRVIDNTLYGIYLLSTDDCNLIQNNASENQHGIYISNCDNIQVINNTVWDNVQGGVRTVLATNSSFIGNIVYDNGWSGINLDSNSHYNSVSYNIAYNNDNGIHVDNSDYNNVTLNYCYNNPDHGIKG